MTHVRDVVIVGGGVMGSAIGRFLTADPAFDGSVTIVERDPTFERASSALSAASIRQQFSTPENIRMSRFSFEWLQQQPGIDLHEAGYLYLAGPSGIDTLRHNHAVQRAEGVDVVLLSPDELAGRFPWLAVDGIAAGSLGRSGEGWFDGYALLRTLRSAAREGGADLVTGEVVALDQRGDRLTSVELGDGSSIPCGTVVDAAGPWAAEVAAMAGVVLPVEARRRSVFVFDVASDLPGCPLVIDPSGAWFRPDGGSFIAAIAPPEAEDLPGLPLEVDHRDFADRLWPALAARVPAFDAIRLLRAWAGYYEVDTWDHNAILGRHPEIANLLFANGFSGHGIQQAPAVGRAIAELIVHGRFVTLDLGVFGFERIAAGRRVVERNVIG